MFLARELFQVAAKQFQTENGVGPNRFISAAVPFASALLFVSHPIQTQAVTYISQRYTSLAACLYLAAVYAFLRFRQELLVGNDKFSWLWGTLTILSAVCAMKSKEIAFTLPLMLALFECLLFKGRLLKKPLVSIAGIALLLLVPLQFMWMSAAVPSGGSFLDHAVKASSETALITRHDYFVTQLRVIVTYIRLMLFPVAQNVDYDYPLYHSVFDPHVLFAVAVHFVLVASVVLQAVRNRAVDGEMSASSRVIVLGICWFYLALSVESSFIPIRDYINEHRLYLPSVGFLIAGVTWVARVSDRLNRQRQFFYGTVVLCAVLSVATVARNRIWRSEMSLWQDTLLKSPAKGRPHHSIGKLLYKQWKPEQAIPYLLRAVELEPKKILYRMTLNETLALTNRFEGRLAPGGAYPQGTAPGDTYEKMTWLAASHNNLGLAYEGITGNWNLARQQYELSVQLNPDFDLGWYNLALLLNRQNDPAGTATALEHLRALNPALAEKAVQRFSR